MTSIPSHEIKTERWKARTTSVIVVLSCCIIASLVVPIPIRGRAWEAIGDLFHAPIFGLIAFAVLLLLRRRFDRRIPLGAAITVACVIFAFGVLIELVQSFTGRSPNAHDVVSNAHGILAAVLIFYAHTLRRSTPRVAVVLLLAGITVIWMAWRQPLLAIIDVIKARREFPVLADFDSSAEFDRFHFRQCKPYLSRQDATSGQYSMELNYLPEPYPGARLQQFNPDWSGIESLEMDLTLDAAYPDNTLEMIIQVLDRKSDDTNTSCFWRKIDLKPGVRQHIKFNRDELVSGPRGRNLQLKAIIAVDWIAIEPAANAKVRIDTIGLKLDGQ